MKILTQKIVLFWFLEVEGKENGVVNMDCWVLFKNSTQRELTHATWLNSRRGILDFSVGSEQFLLGKEQNSNFLKEENPCKLNKAASMLIPRIKPRKLN